MTTVLEGIPHGTSASGWRRGCRCGRCRKALRRAARTWNATRVVVRGGDPATRVPAGPVRRRIAELEAVGWTRTRIAREAGVSPATITRVGNPSTRRTSRIVARSVLAVEPAS